MKHCHGKTISADYRIQFGSPRLVRTCYTVDAIVCALFAGDDVTKTHELTSREVSAVRDYVLKLIERDGEGDLAESFWDGIQKGKP